MKRFIRSSDAEININQQNKRQKILDASASWFEITELFELLLSFLLKDESTITSITLTSKR
jgi:hypothetical protein